MKKLIIFLSIAIFVFHSYSQVSVFSCSNYPTHLSQTDLDGAQQFNNSTCYILGENSSVLLENSANKEIFATHEISLKNDVHLGAFDGSGGAHLQINAKSGLEVAVMNYYNLSNVLRYKKLEFGVQLPDDITSRINRYLFSEGVYNNELNPFLDWEVEVEATFYHIGSGTIKKVDGFYTREYFANPQTDDWDSVATDYAFRVRFAPPLNGEWKASIHVRINKEQVPSHISNDFWFHVIESGDPGYVRVFDNNRNLKQGDKMIFPIGTNFPADFDCVAWHGDCYDPIPGDPVRRLRGTDTIYYGHNLYSNSNSEKASNVYAWNNYLKTLSAYFQSGGKYIRTIQMPWTTLLEFENKGNYYKRLHYAWEQDKILDSLEKYDVLMIFNLMLQSPHFQYDHFGTRDWDWDYDIRDDHGNLITEPWVYDVQRYCYNDQPQGVKKAHESYTNESDLLYHKQRTRYYLARYGYSTKIMEFELLSEPFHVGAQSEVKDTLGNVIIPHLNPYEDGNVAKNAIYNYHKVMSEYMRDSLQTNQLIGVDMGHGVHIDLLSVTLPKVDVVGVNFYYSGPSDLYDKVKENIINPIWATRGSKIPVLFSEGGVNEDYKEYSNLSQHPVDMMTFPFTSAAGYLSWFGWRKETESHIWPATIRAQNHMNGDDVISTLSEGGGEWWHDMQKEKLKKGFLGWGSTEEYLVEQQHYKSSNKDKAVGYVKNRTYNIQTKGCPIYMGVDFDSPNDIEYDDVKHKNNFVIENLHNKTKYYVNWYSYKYGNYLKTDHLKTNSSGKLKLEFPTLNFTEPKNPVVWFVVHKDFSNGMILNDDTEEERMESLIELQLDEMDIPQNSFANSIYPNPFTDEIIINSLEDDFFVLSNSSGKVIKEIKITKGRNKITLDDLAKGLYFAVLKNQVFITKLIRL